MVSHSNAQICSCFSLCLMVNLLLAKSLSLNTVHTPQPSQNAMFQKRIFSLLQQELEFGISLQQTYCTMFSPFFLNLKNHHHYHCLNELPGTPPDLSTPDCNCETSFVQRVLQATTVPMRLKKSVAGWSTRCGDGDISTGPKHVFLVTKHVFLFFFSKLQDLTSLGKRDLLGILSVCQTVYKKVDLSFECFSSG